MNIQWYPGHMTKAKRMLAENLKLIDIVIELVDARIPISSRNPEFDEMFASKYRVVLLNKSDLASKSCTQSWISYFTSHGIYATDFIATSTGKRKAAIAMIEEAAKEKVERMKKKGVKSTVRAMVIGIPNVGKSTLINTIAGEKRAKTSDRPGVTQGKQWVHITPYLEIMDTPGLLWPRFEDQTVARHIAYIGSVRDDILDIEELACSLLSELMQRDSAAVMERYKKITPETEDKELLAGVCKSRGFVLAGGVLDTERAARIVLDEFRAGKIAKVTFEHPRDIKTDDKK